MAICKFYEQGTCKFGTACRNDHIDRNQRTQGARGGFPQQSQSYNQNQNRGGGGYSNQGRDSYNPPQNNRGSQRGGFSQSQPRGDQNANYNQRNQNTYQNRGGFHSDRGGRGRGGARGGGHRRSDLEYIFGRDDINLVKREIESDLTIDRPSWPFSAYGPGKNAPRQLIEGDLEQSMEEMRVHAYLLMHQNPAQITQMEAVAAGVMEETVQKIANNLDEAITYLIDSKEEHPNRLDIMRENSQGSREYSQRGRGGRGGRGGGVFGVRPGGPQRQNGFSSDPPANSGFGQASSGGFGQPAFGQTPFIQATQTAFGQPAFPPQQIPPFGQANGFEQPQNNFQMGQQVEQDGNIMVDAFVPNQQVQQPPNPFGQQNQISNVPFGQPQMSNGGGFGAPSAIPVDLSGDRSMVDDAPASMFGLSEQVYRETYQQAMQNGGFQGTIPMIAPKKEWMN